MLLIKLGLVHKLLENWCGLHVVPGGQQAVVHAKFPPGFIDFAPGVATPVATASYHELVLEPAIAPQPTQRSPTSAL